MGISEDARKTADAIRERGWTQGGTIGPTGRVCLVGGIRAARGWKDSSISARDFKHVYKWEAPLRNAIAEYLGTDVYNPSNIWRWNDDDRTSQESILEMLENVAIKHAPDEMRSE